MLFCEMVREIQARKIYDKALFDDQRSSMGIYQIRCLVDGKVYVGSAISFNKRWSAHKSLLKRNKHTSHLLQRAWNEYGYKNFIWEILEYVYNSDVLLMLEDEYIESFKSANRKFGFNVRPSSERFSEETRQKIRVFQLGRKHREESKKKMREAHLGKKLSEKSKQKVSEASLGRKHSEEAKKKIREANTGKKHNEETRQKIREANVGKRQSEETKQRISASYALRKELGLIKEDYRKRSTTVLLEYSGEVRTQAEWAEIKGIPVTTLFNRLRRGWSIEQALTTGVKKHATKRGSIQ